MTNNNEIKNVIFDVGDVLFDYRWKDMLSDYGLNDEDILRVGNEMFEDPLWLQLDLEIMDREDILAGYAKNYPKDADAIRWFITHGELMHIPRYDVWEKFHQLKEAGYNMYLLSNYSSDLFNKHTKGASFLEDIDGMVVSYQVHIKKPEPEIYKYLLEKYNLKAEECIFFDDRKENTDAANSLGIRAVTITSKELLLDQMNQLLDMKYDK